MAQKTVGELNLKLSAQPQNLISGLGSVRGKLREFGDFTSGIFGNLANKVGSFLEKPLFGLFDVAAGADIDRISKAADNLGLMTEQLAALEYAGDLSGTSVAGLTKGLTILNRQLANTSVVGEDATGKLDQFGINSQELLQMSTWDRLMVIADHYKNLESEIDRTGLAMQAFGKGGFEMMKLLEEGSEGIREMTEEARLFGLTFNRRQGAQVEAAMDALSRAQKIFEGVRKQFTIAMAPVVEKLVTLFADWVKGLGGVDKLVNKIANVFFDIAAVLAGIIDGLKNLKPSAIDEAKRSPTSAFSMLFPGQVAAETAKSTAAVDAVEKLRKAMNDAFAPEQGTTIGFAMSEHLGAVRRALKEQEKLKEEMKEAAEKDRQAAEKLALSLADSLMSPAEQATKRFEELNDVFGRGLLSADLYKRGLVKLGDELMQATMMQQELNRAIGPEKALLAGTADATRVAQQFDLQQRTNPAANAMNEIQKQMKALQEVNNADQRRLLGEVIRQLGGQPLP